MFFFYFVAFIFLCGKQIDQAGGPVHSRFVGDIVPVVVMIDYLVALKFSVFIAAYNGNPTLLFENTSLNRAIHQAAQRLITMKNRE